MSTTFHPDLKHFSLGDKVEACFTRVANRQLPPDAEIIYKARNTLWRFAAPGGLSVVVKSFHRPRLVNAIVYTTLRKSKARRSFENANRLLAAGFQTPRPLAYIECRAGLRLGHSYYFSATVEARTLRDIAERPECEAVLRQAATELAALHRLGIFMRDYSPGNILYTLDRDGRPTLYYVDLNRIDFNITSRRKQMANFGAIFFDAPTLERFARLYAEAAGLDAGATVAEAVAAHRRYLLRKSRLRRLKQLLGIKKRRRD